jgi:exodeoxyribonuclease VII small subunit
MAKKMTFEEAMKRLEAIVKRLEDGDVPLEESIKLYEEGMRLGTLCNSILNEAEKRIESLSKGAAPEPEGGDE